jgi:hypothetical protein
LASLALLLQPFRMAREQFADHRRGGVLGERARPKTQRDKQAKPDRGHGQRKHRASLPDKRHTVLGALFLIAPPRARTRSAAQGTRKFPCFGRTVDCNPLASGRGLGGSVTAWVSAPIVLGQELLGDNGWVLKHGSPESGRGRSPSVDGCWVCRVCFVLRLKLGQNDIPEGGGG